MARGLLIDLFICTHEYIANCKWRMAIYFRCIGLKVIKKDKLFSMGIRDIVFEKQ
jgi:hypothetical protein